MAKFLNLKDDDEAEDEEGATRVKEVAAARQGEETEAREEVTKYGLVGAIEATIGDTV